LARFRNAKDFRLRFFAGAQWLCRFDGIGVTKGFGGVNLEKNNFLYGGVLVTLIPPPQADARWKPTYQTQSECNVIF